MWQLTWVENSIGLSLHFHDDGLIQEPSKRKHETQAVATQRPNLSLTKLKRRHLKAIRAGWDFNTIEDFNSFEGIDNETPIKVHPTDHEKDTFHVCNFDLNDQALMPVV